MSFPCNFMAETEKNENNFEIIQVFILTLILISIIYIFYHGKYIIEMLRFYINFLPFQGQSKIYNIEKCPICLSEFEVPIVTSCGHAYCIFCLLHYFKHINYKLKCPLCRTLIRSITCLNNFSFSKTEKLKVNNAREELEKFISEQEDIY